MLRSGQKPASSRAMASINASEGKLSGDRRVRRRQYIVPIIRMALPKVRITFTLRHPPFYILRRCLVESPVQGCVLLFRSLSGALHGISICLSHMHKAGGSLLTDAAAVGTRNIWAPFTHFPFSPLVFTPRGSD